jgi:hypothetical protein
VARAKSAWLQADIDQRALDKAAARINAYSKRQYVPRMQKVYVESVRTIVNPMKRAAPRNHYPDPQGEKVKYKRPGRRGALRLSINSRGNKLRPDELGAATAGPRSRIAPHRHLVVRGTNPRPHPRDLMVFVPRTYMKRGSKKSGTIRIKYEKPAKVKDAAGNSTGENALRFMRSPRGMYPGARAQPFVADTVKRYAPQIQNNIRRESIRMGSIVTLGTRGVGSGGIRVF